MHRFQNPDHPTVQAIYVQTDAQRSAYRVVDAIDELDYQMGAYRALQQLTAINGASIVHTLEPIKRRDMAVLLEMINANLETCLAKVRDAAVSSAKG